MKVIIINGSGGSGKDTVVELCTTYLRDKFCVQNISTIDRIKQIARQMDWDGEKDDKGRRFLADLKEASIRYNNGANDWVMKQILDYSSNENISGEEFIIFVHCREPYAISWFVKQLKNRGIDVSTLLIKRRNIEEFHNDADRDVDCFKYNIILSNNGNLKELEEKCKVLSQVITSNQEDKAIYI